MPENSCSKEAKPMKNNQQQFSIFGFFYGYYYYFG